FFASGKRISSGNVDTSGIAGQLVNSRNAVLQRWDNLPPNFSGSISGGKTFAVGESDLGVIATASYSNGFTTRDALQQTSLTGDLSQSRNDFKRIPPDLRMDLNGMLGFGLEFADHTVRRTSHYIHVPIKPERLGMGERIQRPTNLMQHATDWYEQQLSN